MPWQIVHRCSLFESFFFLCGNIPHFLPGEDRPDRARRQEVGGVGRRGTEPRNGVCPRNASHLFKDISQDSAEWRKDAAPRLAHASVSTSRPWFGLLFLGLPQKSEREAVGVDARSANRSGVKTERERLSQWSCVHSFMSFVSPEEISAKLIEPNV